MKCKYCQEPIVTHAETQAGRDCIERFAYPKCWICGRFAVVSVFAPDAVELKRCEPCKRAEKTLREEARLAVQCAYCGQFGGAHNKPECAG
jgi:hypothetical protein